MTGIIEYYHIKFYIKRNDESVSSRGLLIIVYYFNGRLTVRKAKGHDGKTHSFSPICITSLLSPTHPEGIPNTWVFARSNLIPQLRIARENH